MAGYTQPRSAFGPRSHREGDQSRNLAALVPGSRLVPLDSANHLLPARDPAWTHFLADVHAFLASAP